MGSNKPKILCILTISLVIIPVICGPFLVHVHAETSYQNVLSYIMDAMESLDYVSMDLDDIYHMIDPNENGFDLWRAEDATSDMMYEISRIALNINEIHLLFDEIHVAQPSDLSSNLIAHLNHVEILISQLAIMMDVLGASLNDAQTTYAYDGEISDEKVQDMQDIISVTDSTRSDIADNLEVIRQIFVLNYLSPWGDEDGDDRENFLDLRGSGGLVDYRIEEDSIGVEADIDLFHTGIKIPVKIYMIIPEDTWDVRGYGNWKKDHVTADDYNIITKDLKNSYIPFVIIFEFKKDHLTMMPFIGSFFEFLPTDNEETVRLCATLGYLDPITIIEIIQVWENSPIAVLPNLVYTFPCIVDGDGLTSVETGDKLWFRFTSPMELTVENTEKFVVGTFLNIASLAAGDFTGVLKDQILGFFAMFINDIAWRLINDIRGNYNALAVRLDDYQGDVDLALIVDGELVLGSDGKEIIYNSSYGVFTGDYSTELMFVYTDAIKTSDVTLDVITDDVTEVENISLSWKTFGDGELVDEGVAKYTIDKDTEISTGIAQYSVVPQIGSITLSVTDEDGTPLEGASVKDTIRPLNQTGLTGSTGEDGVVVFVDVLIGNYGFNVSKSLYESMVVDVELAAGETKNVDVSLDLVPAHFVLSDLTVPSSTTVGEEISVSVYVQNIGGKTGSYQTDMVINDEFSIGGSSVMLESGESGNIFFKHFFDSAGTFSIQVEGMSDQIIVNEPEPETPGGIPGFPIESLMLSIMLVSVIMWMMRKRI